MSKDAKITPYLMNETLTNQPYIIPHHKHITHSYMGVSPQGGTYSVLSIDRKSQAMVGIAQQ